MPLTLPGLGFFENLRAEGGDLVGTGWKKHAVSQKMFVHFTWNWIAFVKKWRRQQ